MAEPARKSAGSDNRPQLPAPRWPDVPFADVPTAESMRTLHMHLYAEPEGDNRPVVVYVYGGGWFYGDHTNRRNNNLFLSELLQLTREGFVIAAVEHRTGPEAPFPAQIHDIKGAVRFLRTHASDYGIDPDRIGMLGESSGGHLCTLMALTGDNPDLEGDSGGNQGHSSRIQAAVDFFGPTDLLTYLDEYDRELLGPGGPLCMPVKGKTPEEWPLYTPDAMLLGYAGPGKSTRHLMEVAAAGDTSDPDWRYVELARKASPLHYVCSESAPLLILQGMRDPLLPYAQSWRLYLALCREGADVWFMSRNQAGHGPTMGNLCDGTALDFLRMKLRGRL